MKLLPFRILPLAALLCLPAATLLARTPVGTAFTYQGQLMQSGNPLSATADLQFTLWDAAASGAAVGTPVVASGVNVVDGLFTVQLDFGAAAFAGEARWLEVAVRSPAGSGTFTTLSPRQPLAAVPYALYALNADTPWEVLGNRVYYSRGAVSVGTADASGMFHVFAEDEPAITATVTGEDGHGLVAATTGLAAVAVKATSDGPEAKALEATASGEDAVVIDARAQGEARTAISARATALPGYYTPPNRAGTFYASEAAGVGVFGHVDGSTGYGVHGKAEGTSSRGVFGEATASSGTGVYGYASSGSGFTRGVWGNVASPDGYAGYFTGRSYFSGNVGIGTASPQARLHIGGTAGVDGILFPDGSLQTTAAGGGGSSLWSVSGDDIFYTTGSVGIGTNTPAERLHVKGSLLQDSSYGSIQMIHGGTGNGWRFATTSGGSTFLLGSVPGGTYPLTVTSGGNIGIGTTSPTEKLHVTNHTRIDGSLGLGTVPLGGVKLDVAGATTFGIRVENIAENAIGLYTRTTAASSTTYGLIGSATSPQGVGIFGHHEASTGDAPGVHGVTNSASSLAVGVKGEATATSGGFTVGVMGLSHAPLSVGVYGKADNASVATKGGHFESTSPNGFGVYGVAHGNNAFAGYFSGRGYFSENVGIGTVTPAAKLHVAGTARVDVLEITGGADLSERFAVDAQAEAGMVVAIDPDRPGALRTASVPYDRRVAGIVSGAGGINTGMRMGQAGSVADGERAVALTGRVYCWCDASGGAIEPGDMLTTSSTPGHAMKVTDYSRAQGAVIGKAMSPLREGRGLVLVLVNLQ